MVYHVGHYLRVLNLLPKVTVVGYLDNKTEAVQKSFRSCNFSFIIRGSGWYVLDGVKYLVKAPSILLQWPGQKMDYGPDNDWDEFFFIYGVESLNLLIKSGVFNTNTPVLPLDGVIETVTILNDIKNLIKEKPAKFPADRLDLLCWQAICETHILRDKDSLKSDNEKKILVIASSIRSNPLKPHNFKSIASELGMSLPTFRRYWQEYIGVSPARYIADLKLSAACKLLAESDKTIGEVAHSINFDDKLYFSRFFKKKTGLTPREYRKNYNIKIS